MKMVVRPKHVADNLNKIVNNLKLVVCILLRVLGQVQGFRFRIQTTNFKIINASQAYSIQKNITIK
jgi:hypothetical protein